MKRILALLLAVLLTAALCSCSDEGKDTTGETIVEVSTEVSETYYTVETDQTENDSPYKAIQPRHCYSVLPLDSERELYDKLLNIYRDISPEKKDDTDLYSMPQVEIKAPLNEAQVRTVIKAISSDYPEFFWASGTIGLYTDDESTIVQMYSRYSPEEVDSMLNDLLDVVDEFISDLAENMTDFDIELKAHDYLLDRAEYDHSVDPNNTDKNDPKIYTAYGALVDKLAVCEGYARAYQLMLNKAGVDCVGISGVGSEDLHMWNAVSLDGKWYLVDTTWDDHDEIYFKYDYFNLTTEEMNKDHTPAPMFDELSDEEINGETGEVNCDIMNMFIPECTDPTMGYYYRNCPWLKDCDGGADIMEPLYEAAKNKEEMFLFYVDDSLDFEETLNVLFSEKPQYFFGYVEEVNKKLTDYSIDTSNLSYYFVDKCRIVAANLTYL